MTDSNLGGVEKLCCSLPVSGMMATRPKMSASEVSASDAASKLVDPLEFSLSRDGRDPLRPTAWSSLSSFQQAYQVGKLEAGAALNLLKEVPTVIADRLKALVEYFYRNSSLQEYLQRVTCGFIAACEALKQQVAEDFAESELISVRKALHAEMQSVSFKQKLASMDDDLSSMTSWCIRYQDNANRQGALDLKYATDRYNNGIKEAEKVMCARHKVVLQEDFSQAHATIMSFVHAVGEGSPPPLDMNSPTIVRRFMKAFAFYILVGELSKARHQATLDGLGCHLLASQFSEWGQAVWERQKAVLQGSTGKDWYVIFLLTQAEHDEWKDPVVFRLPGLMTGQIVEETSACSKPTLFWGIVFTDRLLASSPAVGNSKVKVQVTQNMELYLTNESNEDLAVGPMELFGFGLGSFSEQLTRDAKHNKQAMHFLLKNDGDLVVYQGEEMREKKIFNLASLICHIGQQHGVMDINLQTYNLEPMMKEATNSELRAIRPCADDSKEAKVVKSVAAMPVQDVTGLSDDDNNDKSPAPNGSRPSGADDEPPAAPKKKAKTKPAKRPSAADVAEADDDAGENEEPEVNNTVEAEVEPGQDVAENPGPKAKAKAKGQSKSKPKVKAKPKATAASSSSGMKRPAAAMRRPAAASAEPSEPKKIKAYKCFYSRDGVHGIKVGEHEVKPRKGVSAARLREIAESLLVAAQNKGESEAAPAADADANAAAEADDVNELGAEDAEEEAAEVDQNVDVS
eukprot:s3000_g10.t1